MKWLAVSVVLAAACNRSPEECRAYANDLGALLEATAAERPSPVYVYPEVKLVERADLPMRDFPYGPTLELGPKLDRLSGVVITRDEMPSRLAAARKDADAAARRPGTRGDDVPEPRLLYIAIDASTPWPDVVSAVDAARAANLTAIGFAFHAPPVPVKAPPRSALDDKLDDMLRDDAPNRGSELAKLLKAQIRGCPQVETTISIAMASSDGNHAMQAAKAMPVALVDCACRVDMPGFRSAMFRLLYIAHPVRVLRLDPDQPAETIALPAGATWADAARQLSPTTRNVTFVVR